MHLALWTAEMFTAEETQIYITPHDPPVAHWGITVYWDKMHTKVIWTFLYKFM